MFYRFTGGGVRGSVYIRFLRNGGLWFRPDGGSLLKSPEAGPVKSKQNALAPPLGTSPRLGVPGRTPIRSVGAKLARDEAGTSNITANCPTAIASKLAPTGESRSHPEPGRLSGRLVFAFDLGRPVNHAG